MSFYNDEDDTAEFANDYSRSGVKRRIGTALLVTGVVVVMLLGSAAIITLAKGRDTPTVPAATRSKGSWADTVPEVSATPIGEPSVPSASPPPASKSPSPSTARTKKSLAPPKQTVLPPPPPKTSPSAGCKPTYKGTQLPKSQVRGYLDTASTTQFWGSNTPAEVQAIRVPVRLLYGTADQESGWQSNIYACDGGVGVMQVMPNTGAWMNQRFGTSYNIDTPKDNVLLGGQYLAWLIRYFGEQLGTFDVLGQDQTLLNAVISAYNWGAGGVDLAKGDAGIPNWTYVRNVKALMTSCCANY